MSTNSEAIGRFKTLDYSKDYYEEHANAGLDYLGHGYWQESYATMVVDATLQRDFNQPFIIDAGCACGSILQGFRKMGVFEKVLGVDLSEHMIVLGRKHFGYSDSELVSGSIKHIPAIDGSASLVHTAQVLEHVPDEDIDEIIADFARVLRPGGRAFICLDAVRAGETKEMYMGDPTHLNIQPIEYWTKKFHRNNLMFDVEAYNRFVRSRQGPTEGIARSFFETYPYWSLWVLQKVE